MTFAAAGRWAFARNAHCSAFARNLNIGLRLHRGISSASPILRLASETRPLQGFVEQRSSVTGLARDVCSGAELEEVGAVEALQAAAAILDGIAQVDGSVACCLGRSFEFYANRHNEISGLGKTL
eukprot:TRINITY_DN67135_c0_g1_i1.p1 TRINITY_DN67135_c0_g1~~TRINITY_DN67135_c0_g1_i1.p1  ORF type:complete len:125 (-),score=17.79 TRINITY_DN67135_c0_g1_i1:234-608(-)